MKKIIFFFLALAFVISFVSCGPNSDNDSTTTQSTTVSTTSFEELLEVILDGDYYFANTNCVTMKILENDNKTVLKNDHGKLEIQEFTKTSSKPVVYYLLPVESSKTGTEQMYSKVILDTRDYTYFEVGKMRLKDTIASLVFKTFDAIKENNEYTSSCEYTDDKLNVKKTTISDTSCKYVLSIEFDDYSSTEAYIPNYVSLADKLNKLTPYIETIDAVKLEHAESELMILDEITSHESIEVLGLLQDVRLKLIDVYYNSSIIETMSKSLEYANKYASDLVELIAKIHTKLGKACLKIGLDNYDYDMFTSGVLHLRSAYSINHDPEVAELLNTSIIKSMFLFNDNYPLTFFNTTINGTVDDTSSFYTSVMRGMEFYLHLSATEKDENFYEGWLDSLTQSFIIHIYNSNAELERTMRVEIDLTQDDFACKIEPFETNGTRIIVVMLESYYDEVLSSREDDSENLLTLDYATFAIVKVNVGIRK
ncbi:MAG: hypothetical protein MJ236_06230 [Clostridia bacterium]|nr:hypothetical protein [Clostridia bacterium]